MLKCCPRVSDATIGGNTAWLVIIMSMQHIVTFAEVLIVIVCLFN